jgi:hypothetical protein
MFDHVKRVKGWTTMACHVYDSAYCRVMTIAVCDMQSENVTAQSLLWHGLNEVMLRHDIAKVNFKGFMVDNAQANWNAVLIIYDSGDPKVLMESRERTCLLHWTVSMERHTATHIKPDLQQQHKLLCKQYKNAKIPEQSESVILPSGFGGFPLELHSRKESGTLIHGLHSGTFVTVNGVVSCN